MQPYRSSAQRCPTCVELPLRAFQDRLVCDDCAGLFIAEPDFLSACDDLAAVELSLAFDNAEPIERRCPRCEHHLESTTLSLDPLKISLSVLRCARDGVWIENDQLTRTFARIGRKTHGITRKTYPKEHNARIGLDGIAVPSGAPATAGLVIGQRRPRKRAKTATPINLYRDHDLMCPRCGDARLRFHGDRYACERCAGSFVESTALASMVSDITHQPWDIPPVDGELGARPCPVCAEPMTVDALERVEIDRCTAHGVWFDPDELLTTLENASGQFEPHGVRAWLRRLFS